MLVNVRTWLKDYFEIIRLWSSCQQDRTEEGLASLHKYYFEN